MYDLLSLEVWSITFPVGLQIQHAKDLTTFSPFPTAALTTAFGPTVVTLLILVILTFSLKLLVLAADFRFKALLTSECLAVLIDVAALGEFCLAALTGTCPNFVATAVGTKLLLGCGNPSIIIQHCSRTTISTVSCYERRSSIATQQDIAIWLAFQMKFETLQVPQTTCRTSAVRQRDQDDPHDDAHPEG
ncbi:hypothetical protein Tco_0535121 [Tanacetum coccineum]